MPDKFNLERFVTAQASCYDQVTEELRDGEKRTHWIWFIFPQLEGLGQSGTANYYGLSGPKEATAYLHHLRLSARLSECTDLVLRWVGGKSAEDIFGELDAMKLKSSMTLFDAISPTRANSFARLIDGFYDGQRDQRTLGLLQPRPPVNCSSQPAEEIA